jgi:hypothetical protein
MSPNLSDVPEKFRIFTDKVLSRARQMSEYIMTTSINVVAASL